MRIALYSGALAKDKDGVAKTLHELVSSIREAGHEAMLWTSDVPVGTICGFDIHRAFSLPLLIYRDYRIGFYGPEIKAKLGRFAPDVFHISTPDVIGYNFLKYARWRGIPVVSVYHTDFMAYLRYYNISLLKKLGWAYGRWFYNKCDTVFVPTERIRSELREQGIRNAKIWSRGIHPDSYSPVFRSAALRRRWGLDGKFVILYVGRFVWYKDLSVLIRIYERIKDLGRSDIGFVLVGSGPCERELQRRLPEAVFPGYLVGPELSETYASGDLLVHPSTTETFGNVVLEAMASGLPVVVADRGGCPELVDKSGGGLVAEAWRPGSFVDRILKLRDDQDLYGWCGESALAFARRRSWKEINSVIIDEYRRLAEKRS